MCGNSMKSCRFRGRRRISGWNFYSLAAGKMLAIALLLVSTLLAASPVVVSAILVDASTVRVNYYKNLYRSEPQRLIECNSLALLANLEASAACNESDSELFRAYNSDIDICQRRRGAGVLQLASDAASVIRASSRNVSLDNEFAIRGVGENATETEIGVNSSRERKKKTQDNVHQVAAGEEALLRLMAGKLLDMQQPVLVTGRDSVSARCRSETTRYMNALKDFQIWAVRMLDASAKLPSGILNGNVNQFGDFDQCLRVQEPSQTKRGIRSNDEGIRGKYCLAYLQPTLPDDNKYGSLQYFYDRVQSWGAFRSTFDDPGHRVPRFSTINWAMCVPSGCSHTDVEVVLRESLANFTQGLRFKMQVRVEEEMCQVYQSPLDKVDRNSVYAIVFFATFIALALGMTLYDHYVPESTEKSEWLTTFSLKKNVASLISLKREGSDIPSVHGIRFINAMMLVVAHKSMALFFQPFANRTDMSETLGQPWTVIGRAASLYTDPFIMLSGLLTTYSLYGRLQRGQKLSIIKEYISRLLRIVPTLGALILFCTFILPLLGSGPQWNLVVTHHATICKSYWWRNLLFIHNYFGFENMCLTHTHHVGIDTQLFLLAPLITLALFRWPKRTLQVISGLAIVSTIARFYVTVDKKLSNYVFFGTSVSQLFDTANFMYILPAHRLTVYLMGVALAFILRHTKGMQLTRKQLQIGWYVNIVLLIAAFFGPAPMGSRDYVYNSTHAAHYAAFGPIGYCSFFGWVIFTHHLGHHTWLSRHFSWKGFMVTTRLSYAIYLTQFPVFFYNVGVTRTADIYEFIRMTININELTWIVLTSVALTLFFDTPFGNIKKLLFKSPKSTVKAAPVSSTTTSANNNLIATKNQNTDTSSEVATKEL